MTSYRVDIADCPNCGNRITVWVVASCNTIGATIFTDGFVDAPMYDESGAILECPECETVFWRTDMAVSSSVRDSKFCSDTENRKHPIARKPELERYPGLVEERPWRSDKEEAYIRLRAWWAWNHALGEDARSNKEFPPAAISNCERLLELIDDGKDDGAIMRAEINRELGRFQECLSLLDRPFTDKYSAVLQVIRDAANKEKRVVRPIK